MNTNTARKGKSVNYYLRQVKNLLLKDPKALEEAIMPTVFDIYSYPDESPNSFLGKKESAIKRERNNR